MTTSRFNIAILQDSDVIPSQSDLPGNRNLLEAPLGDWIQAALEVTDEEEAKAKLLDITAVYLWRNIGVLSWAKAVAMARDSVAWMAFARDVKHGNGFTGKTEPEEGKDAHTRLAWRKENTYWRDLVFNWYGAKVVLRDESSKRPERHSYKMEAISRRLHNRTGSRPQVQEPAEAQGSLF